MDKQGVILEEKKPFSSSRIWDFMRAYYAQSGIDAWTDDVPFYVTSNPCIADHYANVIVRFFQDWVKQNPDSINDTFYLLELGTGPGQFSYLILKRLCAIHQQLGMESIRFCYVMSDFSDKTISFWKSHPQLQPFVEQGVLDFAKLDLESEPDLCTEHHKTRFYKGELRNPLVVIANYLFDTLRHDIFSVQSGDIMASHVSLSTQPKNIHNGQPISWEKVNIEHHAEPIEESYYEDPIYHQILELYQKHLSDSHVLFPNAVLDALKHISAIANDNLLLLTSDKGYTLLEELDDQAHPELAFHGSFSVMVNFHAIESYFQLSGGDAYLQTPREGISTAVFSKGFMFSDMPETALALQQYVETFSPGDYYLIHEAMCRLNHSLTLSEIAALLALSRWDPYIFEQVRDRMFKLLETADHDTINYVSKNLPLMADHFYRVPASADIFSDIAIFYHDSGQYEPALRFYDLSIKHFGHTDLVLYNLGICYHELDRHKEALSCLNASLKIDPRSKDTKRWIKVVEAALQSQQEGG